MPRRSCTAFRELADERLAHTQVAMAAPVAAAGAEEFSMRVRELSRLIEDKHEQHQAQVEDLRMELVREHDARGYELGEARTSWCVEAKQLKENLDGLRLAMEDVAARDLQGSGVNARVDAQVQELAAVLESERRMWKSGLEELHVHVNERLAEHSQRAVSGSSGTGETVRELAGYLEAECKARKTDVEELRQQLSLTEALVVERAAPETLQSSIGELDVRLGCLVDALDTEREARRNDADRHQMSLSDLRDELNAESKLRMADVEKLRAALADSALSMQAAMAGEASIESSQGLTKAEAGALRSDLSAALGREATELSTRLRGLGAELRAELASRLESATAGLRSEVAGARAELRGDISASCADLRAELGRQIEASTAELRAQGAASTALGDGAGSGLHSSAAVMAQLGEVTRLMQVITASSELLAEKICGEASARRASEGRVELRLLAAERRLVGLCGSEEPAAAELELEPPQQAPCSSEEQRPLQQQQQLQLQQQLQAQSLISEDLKDSLEKLVHRVNRMLKPEEGGTTPSAQREGSFPPGARPSRATTHSPDRQRSGPLHPQQPGASGLYPAVQDAGLAMPGSPAATPSNPEAAARHPANFFPPSATPTSLAARMGAKAATPQVSKVSEQTKLIQKAVHDLKQENHALRGELNGAGSPASNLRAESLAQPMNGVGVASGSAPAAPRVPAVHRGSVTLGDSAASGVSSMSGSISKSSPRSGSLQGAPSQGAVRGMQVSRGVAPAATGAYAARGVPQGVRRNIMQQGYPRTGSPTRHLAPSR